MRIGGVVRRQLETVTAGQIPSRVAARQRNSPNVRLQFGARRWMGSGVMSRRRSSSLLTEQRAHGGRSGRI